MLINRPWLIIILILVSIVLGGLLSPIFIFDGLIPINFFSFRLVELMRLIVMVFLGLCVAYWVATKTDTERKRKELCLKLIDEGNQILAGQKDKTIVFLQTDNKEEGKIVLSGFRRLSNKIHTISKLCEKIDSNIDTAKLREKLLELKTQFGDNYYSSEFDNSLKQTLEKDFDNYEKILDDLRLTVIL